MRKTEQAPKEKSRIYIKRAFKAIRKYPQVEGYYVMSAADLARDIDYYPSAISGFLRLLEKKGLIETKRSFAMFGTMHKVGIKIYPCLSEKGGKFERKEI